MKKCLFIFAMIGSSFCFASHLKESEFKKNEDVIKGLSANEESKDFFFAVNKGEAEKVENYLKRREEDPKKYPPMTNVFVAQDALKYASQKSITEKLNAFIKRNQGAVGTSGVASSLFDE